MILLLFSIINRFIFQLVHDSIIFYFIFILLIFLNILFDYTLYVMIIFSHLSRFFTWLLIRKFFISNYLFKTLFLSGLATHFLNLFWPFVFYNHFFFHCYSIWICRLLLFKFFVFILFIIFIFYQIHIIFNILKICWLLNNFII